MPIRYKREEREGSVRRTGTDTDTDEDGMVAGRSVPSIMCFNLCKYKKEAEFTKKVWIRYVKIDM